MHWFKLHLFRYLFLELNWYRWINKKVFLFQSYFKRVIIAINNCLILFPFNVKRQLTSYKSCRYDNGNKILHFENQLWSRGVQGHTPPEKFEILNSLRYNFKHHGTYLSKLCYPDIDARIISSKILISLFEHQNGLTAGGFLPPHRF